jgi:hypothetical protein
LSSFTERKFLKDSFIRDIYSEGHFLKGRIKGSALVKEKGWNILIARKEKSKYMWYAE